MRPLVIPVQDKYIVKCYHALHHCIRLEFLPLVKLNFLSISYLWYVCATFFYWSLTHFLPCLSMVFPATTMKMTLNHWCLLPCLRSSWRHKSLHVSLKSLSRRLHNISFWASLSSWQDISHPLWSSLLLIFASAVQLILWNWCTGMILAVFESYPND